MKVNEKFKITTAVSRYADLAEGWLKYYDAVYLGDPFCPKLKNNLLNSKEQLSKAINLLKNDHKGAYLATPIGVTDEQLPALQEIIGIAIELGVDAIEVYDMGILHFLANYHKKIPIIANSFIHVFNFQSARLLQEYGIKRIIPYPELDKEELDSIKEGASLEIELPIHGKIPLGYTETCLIRKREKSIDHCAGDCFNGYFLKYESAKIKTAGRLTLSGPDLCLFNSLPAILKKGINIFRIESRFEDNEYRLRVGDIYRGYIMNLNDHNATDTESAIQALSGLSADGFCNGYFFSKPGRRYFTDDLA